MDSAISQLLRVHEALQEWNYSKSDLQAGTCALLDATCRLRRYLDSWPLQHSPAAPNLPQRPSIATGAAGSRPRHAGAQLTSNSVPPERQDRAAANNVSISLGSGQAEPQAAAAADDAVLVDHSGAAQPQGRQSRDRELLALTCQELAQAQYLHALALCAAGRGRASDPWVAGLGYSLRLADEAWSACAAGVGQRPPSATQQHATAAAAVLAYPSASAEAGPSRQHDCGRRGQGAVPEQERHAAATAPEPNLQWASCTADTVDRAAKTAELSRAEELGAAAPPPPQLNRPPLIYDGVLPAALLQRLAAAFDPGGATPYWRQHQYGKWSTPFFSYLYRLDQPPSTVVEEAIQRMHEALLLQAAAAVAEMQPAEGNVPQPAELQKATRPQPTEHDAGARAGDGAEVRRERMPPGTYPRSRGHNIQSSYSLMPDSMPNPDGDFSTTGRGAAVALAVAPRRTSGSGPAMTAAASPKTGDRSGEGVAVEQRTTAEAAAAVAAALRGAAVVEWWAHTRDPAAAHQLHFDVNEDVLRQGLGSYCLEHPLYSSVLYLPPAAPAVAACKLASEAAAAAMAVAAAAAAATAGAAAAPSRSYSCSIVPPGMNHGPPQCPGGPTLVLDQTPLGARAADNRRNDLPNDPTDLDPDTACGRAAAPLAVRAWAVGPRPNRLLVFPGNLLHGVMPQPPWPEPEPPSQHRQPSTVAQPLRPEQSYGGATAAQPRTTLIVAWWGCDRLRTATAAPELVLTGGGSGNRPVGRGHGGPGPRGPRTLKRRRGEGGQGLQRTRGEAGAAAGGRSTEGLSLSKMARWCQVDKVAAVDEGADVGVAGDQADGGDRSGRVRSMHGQPVWRPNSGAGLSTSTRTAKCSSTSSGPASSGSDSSTSSSSGTGSAGAGALNSGGSSGSSSSSTTSSEDTDGEDAVAADLEEEEEEEGGDGDGGFSLRSTQGPDWCHAAELRPGMLLPPPLQRRSSVDTPLAAQPSPPFTSPPDTTTPSAGQKFGRRAPKDRGGDGGGSGDGDGSGGGGDSGSSLRGSAAVDACKAPPTWREWFAGLQDTSSSSSFMVSEPGTRSQRGYAHGSWLSMPACASPAWTRVRAPIGPSEGRYMPRTESHGIVAAATDTGVTPPTATNMAASDENGGFCTQTAVLVGVGDGGGGHVSGQPGNSGDPWVLARQAIRGMAVALGLPRDEVQLLMLELQLLLRKDEEEQEDGAEQEDVEQGRPPSAALRMVMGALELPDLRVFLAHPMDLARLYLHPDHQAPGNGPAAGPETGTGVGNALDAKAASSL